MFAAAWSQREVEEDTFEEAFEFGKDIEDAKVAAAKLQAQLLRLMLTSFKSCCSSGRGCCVFRPEEVAVCSFGGFEETLEEAVEEDPVRFHF